MLLLKELTLLVGEDFSPGLVPLPVGEDLRLLDLPADETPMLEDLLVGDGVERAG